LILVIRDSKIGYNKGMSNITISQNRQKKVKLSRYAGQWVAFVQGKIISHSDNLKNLMRQVDEKGLRKKASVFLVPRQDEGPYILLVL